MMSNLSGLAEQVPSLPKGGGAIQGLGEKFHPDLHTGTGSYGIPLDIPNGPNDIAPKLTLSYHTGAESGPFGMGFGLNLLTISRSTNKRLPTYQGEEDPLVLLGGGELMSLGGGKYRLKVQANSWRVAREGEGFRLTDRDGRFYRLGVTEQSRLSANQNGITKVFSWHLEEIEDALGNKVKFTYNRDKNQLYLARINYSIYSVRFDYEERPDPVLNGRPGFLVTTRLRCRRVELWVNTPAQTLTRRWELAYAQNSSGGHSLLHQVKMIGYDETGQTVSLPVLTLDYTAFCPRELERFRAETPDASPGALQNGRRELMDWDGDGLPDLLEIGGGRSRVWRNLGDCTWARPESLPALPVTVAPDEAKIAFADMEGNGTADLVMLDRPFAGYYPHLPKGGFGQPVFWSRRPEVRLGDPNVRLVDLNGDGIVDLLVTGSTHFSLYYRQSNGGWASQPQTIPRSSVPPVSLEDPRVRLADLNGDGLFDLARVDGSGFTYWPYLGNGCWSEPVTMANSPVFPRRLKVERLFLSDIDGDGCADLVYIDFDRVIFWLNQGGTRWSDPQEIAYTPPAAGAEIRLADMKGNGTAGVLWSYGGWGRRNRDYFYLEMTGGNKPYLLSRVDNGMGLVTVIEYGASTAEARRDKDSGQPWPTFLPFPVPVVTALRTIDQVTATETLVKYRYHNGHFDGMNREFAGFALVEVEEVGDDTVATMLTRNWHHLGLDPQAPDRYLPEPELNRLRILRGKLLKTEIYGMDDDPNRDLPYLRTENDWNYQVQEKVNGVELLNSFLSESRTYHLERRPNPYRVEITRYLAYDQDGNVTEQEQRAVDARGNGPDRVLHTTISYASSERFVGKPARAIQRDGNGQVLATTISYYDGLPEGNIGNQGLLSRQETLVLTDELVSRVYQGQAPDFAGLGYHRGPDGDGWWVNQVTYTRTDDPSGLSGTVTNARGNTTRIFFDQQKIQPQKIIDALGNSVTAQFDYQANKLRVLTDANGVTVFNRYDPLGRLIRTVEPGASEELPTTCYTYNIEALPVWISTQQRTVNGQAGVKTFRTYLDGLGRIIEERVLSEEGEIVERSQLYTARGLVRAQYLPYTAPDGGYSLPAAELHQKFRYDALGRLCEVQKPDGALQKQWYEPGRIFFYDEEDNRIGPSSPHANTPARHTFDQTGRVREVALNINGRWIASQYEYDLKGNLLAVTDPLGHRTIFFYDLLGRRLSTSSTSTGTTLFTFDANGNQVERRDARGELERFEYDQLDRLRRVFFPVTGKVSAEYTYHDTGQPAPFGVGGFCRGRIVKIAHQGGEEWLDFDQLGRIVQKKLLPTGLPNQELQLDFSFRADGQLTGITYPAPAGTERKKYTYEYNQRGLLRQIPGVIRQINYNQAGQRTRVDYANEVTTFFDYDVNNFRLKTLRTQGAAPGILQSFQYTYDLLGNLLQVTSPDPKMAASYEYDDLYRLRQASTQSGQSWKYQYDDLGNLTMKSDLGNYQYDANGLLTSAGDQSFTYTAAGQVWKGPWGESAYDPAGRMTSITRGGEKMSCTYDHHGRRVRMQVTGGSANQDFLTPDDLVSIQNGIILLNIFDGSVRVGQVQPGTDKVFFFHGDHLGSTTLVTGPAGQLLQKIYYDPFGAILENQIAAGGEGTRFLYTGQVFDDWSGLLYLNARYYHPKLGRFVTPDALAPQLYHPLSWNRYSYVLNNPLRFVDPTGHFWDEIGDWFKSCWKYVVAAVAIIAIVVLTVVTFGAAALITVGIGMAIGGVIGGISAYQAGGDILLGVLVGMAVGGAASVASMGIGVGLGTLAVQNGVLVTVKASLAVTLINGALSGAVTGAAMGFTAGFAGGQGSASQIFDRIWKGALVGAAVGLAFSGAAYYFRDTKISFESITAEKAAKSFEKVGAELAKTVGEQANKGELTGASFGAEAGKAIAKEVFGSYVHFGTETGFTILTTTVVQSGLVLLAGGASGVLVLDWADDLWDLMGRKLEVSFSL